MLTDFNLILINLLFMVGPKLLFGGWINTFLMTFTLYRSQQMKSKGKTNRKKEDKEDEDDADVELEDFS